MSKYNTTAWELQQEAGLREAPIPPRIVADCGTGVLPAAD
jgi:hypothetical protein